MNNPKDISFKDFQTLLRQSGWILDHQKGSHQIWYSAKMPRLPIQEGKNGKVKSYQVKQFLTLCKENHNEKS